MCKLNELIINTIFFILIFDKKQNKFKIPSSRINSQLSFEPIKLNMYLKSYWNMFVNVYNYYFFSWLDSIGCLN